jgi:glucose/arabinose dehydrogenase
MIKVILAATMISAVFPAFGQPVVNGQAAFAGWNQQQLGLRHKITVPDVLIQPHMASLQMTFYTSSSGFPQRYQGEAFSAEHGSWNRQNRAGYEVIRIPLHNAVAEGLVCSANDATLQYVIDQTL